MDSSSATLRSFYTKLPSSNFAKVIIFPVCSLYDVAYIIYKTSVWVVSASEYGCDMYADALEKVSPNTTSREENIFHVLGK